MAARKTTSTRRKTASAEAETTNTVMADEATTENVETNSTVQISTKEYEQMKETNAKLLDQLSSVMQKIQELEESQKKVTTRNMSDTVSINDAPEYVEISPSKPIKVISLSTGGVSLRTSSDGRGITGRFTKFGQPRFIPYGDLQDMISTDRSFIEDGVVYICDPDVIRNNYLEDAYSKFLTKETIENILSFNIDQIKDMVSNTTQSIQETIIDLLVQKINRNEQVDMNKLTAIGQCVNQPCDIMQLALSKRITR